MLQWLGLVATLAVATCGALLPAPSVPPAKPEPWRVLVVTGRPSPRVDRALAAMARLKQADGTPAVVADVLVAADVAILRQRLDQLGTGLPTYSAVYAANARVARAVQLAVPQVPIVFEVVADPQQRCIVDRLDRPGRNATGYTHYLRNDDHKALQTFRQAFPGLTQVRVLIDHQNVVDIGCDLDDKGSQDGPEDTCRPGPRPADAYIERRFPAAELSAMAAGMGLTLQFDVVCAIDGQQGLEAVVQQGLAAAKDSTSANAMGWFVPYHVRFDQHADRLVKALNATGRPAIYPLKHFAESGGLMSLSTWSEHGEASPMIDTLHQVLQGASPAMLPVQEPRGFMLTINARTARTLPVRPSLDVLRAADQVLH